MMIALIQHDVMYACEQVQLNTNASQTFGRQVGASVPAKTQRHTLDRIGIM